MPRDIGTIYHLPCSNSYRYVLKIENNKNVNYQANLLVLVVVFYVEWSHLDFLCVTVYETFVEVIRSNNVIVC